MSTPLAPPTRFPPLPARTRLRVDWTESGAEPGLSYSCQSRDRGVMLAVALLPFGFLLLASAVVVVAAASRGRTETLIAAAAIGGATFAAGGGVLWFLLRRPIRYDVRATPDRIERDAFAPLKNTHETFPLAAGVRLPRSEPAVVRGGSVRLRVWNGAVSVNPWEPLCPAVRRSDAAWLRAALAAVYAAAGRPDIAPPAWRLDVVRPGTAAPPHPAVVVREDTAERFELEARPHVWRPGQGAATVVVGLSIAAAPLLAAMLGLFAWKPWLEIAAFSGGCGLGGAFVGTLPFQRTRVTVTAEAVRVSRRLGPVRLRAVVIPTERLAAVAVARDHGRRSPRRGLRDEPPPGDGAAVLLARSAAWNRRLETIIPVPSGSHGEGAGRALAAAVANALAARGWTDAPPVDWRTGWRSPGEDGGTPA